MYTNSIGPGRGENIWLFLAISMLLHAVVLLGYARVSPLSFVTERGGDEPIVVNVVELPEMPESTAKAKKPPTVFSDKERSYERETVPAPLVAVPLPALPSAPAAPAAPAAKKEAGAPQKTSPAKTEQAEARAAPESDFKLGEKAEKDVTGELTAGESPTAPPATTAPTRPVSPRAGAGSSGPNLFPSEERLSQLAREYERAAPSVERGKTLQLNTSELKYQKYLLSMKRRIELRWDYPNLAIQNGWQGILHLDFTINSDGTLAEARVVRSSGYPVLDEAAVTAIRLAAPFPPFPEDFGVETITIKGRFEYLIYGQPAGPQ